MAGGVSKGLGALLLPVGLLLLLGGLAAAGYGLYDDHDKKDVVLYRGGHDEERNQLLMMGGGAGAGLGLVLTILGLVFRRVGRGLSDRSFQKQLLEAQQAAAAAPPEISEPSAPVHAMNPAPASTQRLAAAADLPPTRPAVGTPTAAVASEPEGGVAETAPRRPARKAMKASSKRAAPRKAAKPSRRKR